MTLAWLYGPLVGFTGPCPQTAVQVQSRTRGLFLPHLNKDNILSLNSDQKHFKRDLKLSKYPFYVTLYQFKKKKFSWPR